MTITDITGPASVIGGLIATGVGVHLQHRKDTVVKTEDAAAASVRLFNELNLRLRAEIDRLQALTSSQRTEMSMVRMEVADCENKHAEALTEIMVLRRKVDVLTAEVAELKAHPA